MSRLGLLQGKSLGFISARLTRSGIAHTATISRASLHYALFSGLVLLMLHHLLLAHVLFAFNAHFRGFD